jgi:hypothetical protein
MTGKSASMNSVRPAATSRAAPASALQDDLTTR